MFTLPDDPVELRKVAEIIDQVRIDNLSQAIAYARAYNLLRAAVLGERKVPQSVKERAHAVNSTLVKRLSQIKRSAAIPE